MPYRLRLFGLNMAMDRSLKIVIILDLYDSHCLVPLGLYTRCIIPNSAQSQYRDHWIDLRKPVVKEQITLDLDTRTDDSRLTEVGICYDASQSGANRSKLLRLHNLVIRPKHGISSLWQIVGLNLAKQRAGTFMEMRLTWSWEGPQGRWPPELPYSKTTGPFSSFSVSIGGKDCGRAYSLEFPLRHHDFALLGEAEDTVSVEITGFLFGGGTVAQRWDLTLQEPFLKAFNAGG